MLHLCVWLQISGAIMSRWRPQSQLDVDITAVITHVPAVAGSRPEVRRWSYSSVANTWTNILISAVLQAGRISFSMCSRMYFLRIALPSHPVAVMCCSSTPCGATPGIVSPPFSLQK